MRKEGWQENCQQDKVDKTKLKTNLTIMIILLFVVGGYIFFFLSPRIFSVDESKLLYTPLSQAVQINNEHSLTIEDWEYSQNERKMSVILSLNSTAADPSEKYVYQVVSRNKVKESTLLSYDVTYQSTTFATLMIYDVPTDFTEVAIKVGYIDKHIEDNDSGQNARAIFSTIFTNKNKVDRTDSIEQLSVIELYIGKIKKENATYTDEIKKLTETNADLERQKQDILETVADLRKNESYLTENEQGNLHSQIAKYQSTYDACVEKISSNQKTIDEYQSEMSKNNNKIEELNKLQNKG